MGVVGFVEVCGEGFGGVGEESYVGIDGYEVCVCCEVCVGGGGVEGVYVYWFFCVFDCGEY